MQARRGRGGRRAATLQAPEGLGTPQPGAKSHLLTFNPSPVGLRIAQTQGSARSPGWVLTEGAPLQKERFPPSHSFSGPGSSVM